MLSYRTRKVQRTLRRRLPRCLPSFTLKQTVGLQAKDLVIHFRRSKRNDHCFQWDLVSDTPQKDCPTCLPIESVYFQSLGSSNAEPIVGALT